VSKARDAEVLVIFELGKLGGCMASGSDVKATTDTLNEILSETLERLRAAGFAVAIEGIEAPGTSARVAALLFSESGRDLAAAQRDLVDLFQR
jgi:hypothetical protein